MKKLLLSIILLFSTFVVFAQGLSQPTIFNNVCDENGDGFSSFYLGEISYEILQSLNANNYTVTHHETLSEASLGVNALSSQYFNTIPFQQTIHARVVNNLTNEVQIISYQLNVNQPPVVTNQVLTNCNSVITSFPCWDLESLIPSIQNGIPANSITFYPILADALTGANAMNNTVCYQSLSPGNSLVYFRSESPTGCFSIGEVQLLMIDCIQPGVPQNLTQCVDSGVGCFNLTDNNVNVIGTLNPSNYTISYHISQSEASSDVNPLSSPYCMTAVGTQTIFVRLENNATSEFTIYPFTISTQLVLPDVVMLQDMVNCDDNSDGTVSFNFTTIQAQISSTNVLEYYPSLANAQNQVVPFTNPSSVNIASTIATTNVFVREIVPGGCDVIYTFAAKAFPICNLAYVCNQANSLCSALGIPFSNTTGSPSIGSPGCLGSAPNPTWFYLPVSTAGSIGLLIQQSTDINFSTNNLDVDYVIYGPFTDPITPCGSGLPTESSIVSCSYSAAPVENALISNALPGQYYLIMTTNFSNQPGYIKITQTSGSTGTINCSGLRLNAFLDSNNNGLKDNGESNFPLGQFQYEVNDNDVIHNIASPSGVYDIYEINPANSYDLSFSVDASYASMYNVTTSTYSNVNVVVGSGMIAYNFPVTVVQPYNDLAVTIVPFNDPRPGFVYDNKIIYSNLGNQPITSGTLTFNKDSNVSITNISQVGTTPTTTGFTYNFTNLMPFEVRTITVSMQVPTIPTVNAGQYLTNSASIVPLTGDVVTENNSNTLSQLIVNAYDPNDKMESRGEEILFSSFTSNDYLYYTIRFENTGTASAINVRINDVLDAQLDENSIRMVSTSHPNYIMDRVGNNINWEFDNIQLPVSVANTNIGKGYVMFKIKPKPGFAVGDIIPNTASIYFDFNPAIVTNTFTTEFTAVLNVDEIQSGDFVIYPNPTNDLVTVSLKNNLDTIKNISVYDVVGKQILMIKPNSINQTLDLSSVNSGMYFIEITTDTNLKVTKKIMVK